MKIAFPRKSGRNPQRPEMFDDWSSRFPTANGGITAAIRELGVGYREFCAQSTRIAADETATTAARLVKKAKTARASLLPLIEKLNTAIDGASAHAAQLEAKTAEAYKPQDKKYETCMRHQEIRAHFKSLPNGERIALVQQANKNGDEDTLLAVASCQAYLSGIAPQMHEFARNTLIELHAPQEAAALKAIKEQQDFAGRYRDTLLQTVGDMVDFGKADEFIAAATDELTA